MGIHQHQNSSKGFMNCFIENVSNQLATTLTHVEVHH